MQDIYDQVRKNRPNISDTSVRFYVSTIANLYKQMRNKLTVDDDIHTFFCNNPNEVIDFLKDKTPSRRKTVMASLVVFCDNEDAKKKYREVMMKDDKTSKMIADRQEATPKQKENWISQDELHSIYKKLEKDARPFLNSKDPITQKQFQHLQNYIIISLYTLIAPRRLLDYTEMKIRNFNRETDNYFDKNKFVFNIYKSAKTFGTQEYALPTKLSNIIKKWSKINSSDFLLTDTNGNKMVVSQLHQRLNKILGRQASVNILRHSYLTDKYKDVPALTEMKDTANNMAHGLETALQYVKKK